MPNLTKVASGAAAGAAAGSAAGPWGAGAGALLGGLGGLISGDPEPSDQELAYENAMRELQNLPPLTKEQLTYIPQQYRMVSSINPELMQSEQAGDSSFNGVAQDPALVQAQRDALAGITRVANEGYTSEDLARNAVIEAKTGRDAKSRQDSILSSLAARGQLGQGQELAARLAGNQAATDSQALAAAQLQADRAQARREALTNMGNYSSQLGQQDVNTQLAKSSGMDTMARANAQLRQQTGASNQAAINAARVHNATAEQEIANRNTGLSNSTQQQGVDANKAIQQDAYSRINARLGAKVGGANASDANKASDAAAFTTGANAVSGTVTAGANAYQKYVDDQKKLADEQKKLKDANKVI